MSFKVQILGSNSSLPAYGRHHTSQLVTAGNLHMLIDCGEGTQYQFQKYKVKASRIHHIFISHLHGDHYLGLMGVLFSFHLSGRKKELHIYGQNGLQEIITTHLRWSGASLNYNIVFHVLNPTGKHLLFENKTLKVYSFPLVHKVPCCGFLIKEKPKSRHLQAQLLPEDFPVDHFKKLKEGKDIIDDNGKVIYKNSEYTLAPKRQRSYAFCSDTAYEPELVPYIKNVDLLYHETTFLKENEKWARLTKHSTTYDAAEIAKAAQVDKLLIGHFSARHREIEPFVEECKTIFNETQAAIEGETYEVLE